MTRSFAHIGWRKSPSGVNDTPDGPRQCIERDVIGNPAALRKLTF